MTRYEEPTGAVLIRKEIPADKGCQSLAIVCKYTQMPNEFLDTLGDKYRNADLTQWLPEELRQDTIVFFDVSASSGRSNNTILSFFFGFVHNSGALLHKKREVEVGFSVAQNFLDADKKSDCNLSRLIFPSKVTPSLAVAPTVPSADAMEVDSQAPCTECANLKAKLNELNQTNAALMAAVTTLASTADDKTTPLLDLVCSLLEILTKVGHETVVIENYKDVITQDVSEAKKALVDAIDVCLACAALCAHLKQRSDPLPLNISERMPNCKSCALLVYFVSNWDEVCKALDFYSSQKTEREANQFLSGLSSSVPTER